MANQISFIVFHQVEIHTKSFGFLVNFKIALCQFYQFDYSGFVRVKLVTLWQWDN